MTDGKIIQIPMMGDPYGPGWRLRPRGHDRGIDDHDPRGREDVERKDTADELVPLSPQSLVLSPTSSVVGSSTYVELHCHTCYSFREGASTPRELAEQAAALGYGALAITDRDGLYGAMEFARAAMAAGVRPLIGADVTLQGGYRLVLLAETRTGYANLCQLLSHARLAEAQPALPSPPPVVRLGEKKSSFRSARLEPEQVGTPIGIRPEIPQPEITFADLAQHAEGLIALSGDEHGEVPAAIAAGRYDRAVAAARRYIAWFGRNNFFIELQQTLTCGDMERNQGLLALAQHLGLGVVATNDVWYHARERHRLHDVLVAIKHRTTLDGSHRLRHANSERFLKSAEAMAELFEDVPEALANSLIIAERCRFDLTCDLGYEFPHYPVPPGETPDSYLASICDEAFARKYGGTTLTLPFSQMERKPAVVSPSARDRESAMRTGEGPRGVRQEAGGGSDARLSSGLLSKEESLYLEAEARLEEELGLIKRHNLAGFFLAYYDLLGLAGEIASELKGRDPHLPPDERPVGRGRGSSVSSIVCYLIGLSHIDPMANDLFLGRFLNEELTSVPDIDLDFPRDIREELLKRIWAAFDQGRAALVCAYSTYHGRSAVRDVGKALGLPALEIDHLAKLSDAWSSEGVAREMARLPEYRDRLDAPLWRDLVALTQQIIGLPRHVTQHVGGVVLSARPLSEIVPLEPTRMEGRVMCQWDKDSVDDARMVKIDFLALGMLSLVDECLDTIERRHGQRPDLGRISHEDSKIYEKICAGDTIGLFQIESRAQIATLPHTQPRNLDDLAVQVAIVRPGPIVGGAFRPYMDYRRRAREGEDVHVYYVHPCLEPVLKDTLGVVLYQEQVVQVAMVVAGYTAGEADQLRRNLSRRHGGELVEKDWPAFRDRAAGNSVPEDAARAAFHSVLGFASYGFPKSHAVAFGLLAYESAWLRYTYPAEYYAALLNNQPMGFYTTEVIAGDARRHGVELARPDINLSGVGCTVETDRRIRLGLAEVKGVGEDTAAEIVAEREAHGMFESVPDCARRVALRPEGLENLVMAGAFDGQARGRRELLWQLGLLQSARVGAQGRRVRSLTGTRSTSASAGDARYRQQALPLPIEQDMVTLPSMTAWEQVAAEYEILGLSPEQHAMALLRRYLERGTGEPRGERGKNSILPTAHAVDLPEGTEVCLAGLVVCRQRPSTAKGVLFVSLEDEYGIANVVVYPPLFDAQRTLILTQPFLLVYGRVQRQGTVVHIIARRFERPVVHTDRLIAVSHDFH